MPWYQGLQQTLEGKIARFPATLTLDTYYLLFYRGGTESEALPEKFNPRLTKLQQHKYQKRLRLKGYTNRNVSQHGRIREEGKP